MKACIYPCKTLEACERCSVGLRDFSCGCPVSVRPPTSENILQVQVEILESIILYVNPCCPSCCFLITSSFYFGRNNGLLFNAMLTTPRMLRDTWAVSVYSAPPRGCRFYTPWWNFSKFRLYISKDYLGLRKKKKTENCRLWGHWSRKLLYLKF